MTMGTVRGFLDRLKLRPLERCGDVVVDWSESLQFFRELAEDLIPGRDNEISRDLLGLLAYAWAVRADRREGYDPFEVLHHVRERAWLGYTSPQALAAAIGTELSRADVGRRMVAYLAELAEKRSSYLFLPVVARIDRHQGASPAILRLDHLMDAFGHTQLAGTARQAFALAPKAARERDLFYLALASSGWGQGGQARSGPELNQIAATQLHQLYDDSDRALAGVRADADAYPAAAELAAIAEEVSADAPWLWLEALFIVENWITGPQWFNHAFGIEAVGPSAVLGRD